MLDQAELHAQLLEELVQFSSDPYGFVMWNFPWGERGSSLEDYSGPEPWQEKLLNELGAGIVTLDEAIWRAKQIGEDVEANPLLLARTSGHGIGKSACVSWLILWAISTMEDTKGIVTANTENQLKTKTWAELAKWHAMGLTKSLFRMTATALFSIDPDHEKTWRIDMVPWSEKNMEAFAGLHNKGKRILIIFDEASAIPDPIWETTEGALTDKNTQIIWVNFGNPTKNTGRFRECFSGGRFSHRWNSGAIDSREVSITNKIQIQKWIDDYGEDHDFVRVRVRGMFPRVDATSFISFEIAQEAAKRELPEMNPSGWVIGVDVARYGDDATVIYPRQGRDARSRQPVVLRGANNMAVANEVFRMAMDISATAIFVDGGGVGAGVIDILETMGVTVYEIQFGAASDGVTPGQDSAKYLNKRAEIWGSLRQWLKKGCIPEEIPGLENTLLDELTAPTYTYSRETHIQLESKRDMKRRGVPSPDAADALALTLAYPGFEEVPGGSLGSGESEYHDSNPFHEETSNYA